MPPLRVQILSDLHLEFGNWTFVDAGADVVVLAGDIHTKLRGVRWALTVIKQPCLYVFGNHEFYGAAYPKLVAQARQLCQGTHVTIMDNDALVLDGVTFLGATLWTDFALFGDPRLAGQYAQERMTDYRQIRRSPRYSKLRSIDTAVWHQQSLSWLRGALQQTPGAVVISHHAPSRQSLPEEHREDLLSAAYASDLEALIHSTQPALWVHGHIHQSVNYRIGTTRVLCNPRGYADGIDLNTDFKADLYVDI